MLLERDEKPLPIDDANSDGGKEMNTINFEPQVCFSESRLCSAADTLEALILVQSHCETKSAGGSQDSSSVLLCVLIIISNIFEEYHGREHAGFN